MLRRILILVIFLTLFSSFTILAFKYEDEKSNMYYVNSNDESMLVAIDSDELYVYGFILEDNLTVSNGSRYTSFGDIKNDIPVAIEYLEYTFSVEDIRYLDVDNPDFGSPFANYLINKTKGTKEEFENSLKNLPSSYESSYNIQYLRLANLVNYNSNGYMDATILKNIVNSQEDSDPNTSTVPMTIDIINKVFVNINYIEVECDRDICTYNKQEMDKVALEMTKLINDDVTYINKFEDQTSAQD